MSSCQCRFSDAWRCARDLSLPGQIACYCECHKPREVLDVCEYHGAVAVADFVDARTCKVLAPACQQCVDELHIANNVILKGSKPVKLIQMRLGFSGPLSREELDILERMRISGRQTYGNLNHWP